MDEKLYPVDLASGELQSRELLKENITRVFIEDSGSGRHQLFRMSRHNDDRIDIEFSQFEDDAPFQYRAAE